jgi:hypothetical protein
MSAALFSRGRGAGLSAAIFRKPPEGNFLRMSSFFILAFASKILD